MPDRLALGGDRNQCPECSEFFASTYAFSKHRTGEYTRDANGRTTKRRCLTRDEMTALGMRENPQGFWVGNPMSDEERDRRNEIATLE